MIIHLSTGSQPCRWLGTRVWWAISSMTGQWLSYPKCLADAFGLWVQDFFHQQYFQTYHDIDNIPTSRCFSKLLTTHFYWVLRFILALAAFWETDWNAPGHTTCTQRVWRHCRSPRFSISPTREALLQILHSPRKFQQTPGTNPRYPKIQIWKDFLHKKQVVEGLGYVPRVCWNFLRWMNRFISSLFRNCCTNLPKFNSEFTPEKGPRLKGMHSSKHHCSNIQFVFFQFHPAWDSASDKTVLLVWWFTVSYAFPQVSIPFNGDC